MTTQGSVDQFLSLKHLVLAGVSRSGKKFGNMILKTLKAKGYEITVVHPEATQIDGAECYSSISDLPKRTWGLVTVVAPVHTEKLVRDAASAGIKNVWMQQGSESPDAVAFCRDNGINEVHGECILMFAQPTGFHKFHRWIWGLLGKLPKKA